jgi:dipeptidase
MHTPRPRSLLILVLLLAVLAAAAGLGGSATAPAAPSAAPATTTATTTHWCNFVLAGKDATTDGSVLMGYNNDWAPNNYTYLQVVPGDATHYRYVRILTLGSVPEGGINVKQLGVNFGTATTLDSAVTAADPFVKKGYGGEIWDTILQKCATAQEAITLLGQMSQTGFTVGAAGSFGIADPDEAWVFELLGGHHWVAQRVPDNAVLAHPNIVVVRQIDLADPANFRGSADLQSFAQTIGRYSPSEGPFDVAWAYHDRTVLQSAYNTDRLWGAFDLVAPSLGLTPGMPYATRPVYVVPDEEVSRQDIAAICRYHYEGTSIDQTAGYSLMSPHDQTNRPICYSTTCHSEVWQLRSWKPDDIGGVMWLALSRPCSSTYVPFYDSITSVPAAWSGRTAFNEFRDVAESLDRNGTINGLTRYGYYIPLVRSTYGAFETQCASAQASTEATAAGMNGSARITYLTNYSAQRATQALNLAVGLPAQMP